MDKLEFKSEINKALLGKNNYPADGGTRTYAIHLKKELGAKSKWTGYVYYSSEYSHGEFGQMFGRDGGALRMTFKQLIRKVIRDEPDAVSIVADYKQIK